MVPALRTALVLSTGRTGTKYLAQFFSRHCPEVEAHHASRHSTLINLLSNLHLAGLLPRSMLGFAWRRLKKPQLDQCEKPLFLDSNNHLFALPALLPDLYLSTSVIHVVRDPRTYVVSHLSWARHRPKSFVANYLIPFWQPNGFLIGELPLGKWLRLDAFQRFCWIWHFKNRLIARSAANPEIRYLLVRFEAMTGPDTGAKTLADILQFLHIPPVAVDETEIRRPVNTSGGAVLAPWRDWPPWRCLQLERICGPLMHSYGYGEEDEWHAMLSRAAEQQ